MLKVTVIKKKISQLFIIVMVCCYILNPYQSNFLMFFHNVLHQAEGVIIFIDNEDYSSHDFLSTASKQNKHNHSHKSLHEHKTLSFFKTILNFDTSKNPYSKSKSKFDKHIVTHFFTNNLILETGNILHNYWFVQNKIPMPELKKAGPPPRCVFS